MRTRSTPAKSPLLVLVPCFSIAAVTLLIIVPWSIRLDLHDNVLKWIAPTSAGIWVCITFWAAYQLTFQLASIFFPQNQQCALDRTGDVRFALLYPTCDDFREDSCGSCVQQKYPPSAFRVIICNDNKTDTYNRRIKDFRTAHPQVIESDRADKPEGYKAGNLNHAVQTLVEEPWFIVVDADQVLPEDYLAAMAAVVRNQPSDVAFVQGSQVSDDLPLIDPSGNRITCGRGPTLFQAAMGLEIKIVYERDLSLREHYGFLPFLGHGAAIRRTAWEKVGKFPHVVSEDYAFTMELSRHSFRGVYAENVRSWESYPKDFGSFLIRIGKFSAGTAQLIKKHVGSFLSGPEAGVGKLDFMMAIAWYGIMPLVMLNTYISAYVCHRLWIQSIAAVHPLLPYLFIGMFLLTLVVVVSASGNLKRVWQYWFWTATVYCAAIPISTACFFAGLFGRAKFPRTPKGESYERPPRWLSVLMPILGTIAVWTAVCLLPSPFSPILVGHGISYFVFPLSNIFNKNGIAWVIGRFLVYVPGICFLLALWMMWDWGKL